MAVDIASQTQKWPMWRLLRQIQTNAAVHSGWQNASVREHDLWQGWLSKTPISKKFQITNFGFLLYSVVLPILFLSAFLPMDCGGFVMDDFLKSLPFLFRFQRSPIQERLFVGFVN